jgi:DNA-binding NarL/FixJ family response regulator
MDVTMPGMNGIDAATTLIKGRPPRKVIILSGHQSAKWVQRALRVGARGYVLKTENAQNLADAVMAVHRGGTWFSDAILPVLANLAADPSMAALEPLDRLSHRQRRVLQLVAEGHTNKSIAATLGIAESTVDTHRTELMRRLGLHDVASIVRFACEEGIVGGD